MFDKAKLLLNTTLLLNAIPPGPTIFAGTEPVGIDTAAGLLFGRGAGTGCGSNGVCGEVG